MWSIPALEITEAERGRACSDGCERRRRPSERPNGPGSSCWQQMVCRTARSHQRWGCQRSTWGFWRRRFAEKRLEGLKDLKRSGRPRKYGHDERLKVVAAATSQRPEFDSDWSHRLLADYLSDLGISASQVGRILAELDIKPHQVRGWLTRKEDPSFWERAADVCGLYLSPPTNAIVLSVDEKTAISARSPKHPTKPARPGRPALKEFEYRRNGVASIVAALDVHTGHVRAEQIARNDAEHFIEFLSSVDRLTDPAPRRPPHLGQRQFARGQKDQGLAGRAPAVCCPPHAQACQLAQPSRAGIFYTRPGGC